MATNSNDENEFKFTKDELADFKRFWESKTGEKYKAKIKRTKDQLLEAAMGTQDRDGVFRYACIANGLGSILEDIKAIIDSIDSEKKKGATAKDAK